MVKLALYVKTTPVASHFTEPVLAEATLGKASAIRPMIGIARRVENIRNSPR